MAVVEGRERKVNDSFKALIRHLDRRRLARRVFFLLIKLILLSLTGYAIIALCPEGWRIIVKIAIWLATSLVVLYFINLVRDGVEHNYPVFDLIVDNFDFYKPTEEEKEAERLKFAEYDPDVQLFVLEDGRIGCTGSDAYFKKIRRRYYARIISAFAVLIGCCWLSSKAAIGVLPEKWPTYVKLSIACVVGIFIFYLVGLAQDGLTYRKKQKAEQARDKQRMINKRASA